MTGFQGAAPKPTVIICIGTRFGAGHVLHVNIRKKEKIRKLLPYFCSLNIVFTACILHRVFKSPPSEGTEGQPVSCVPEHKSCACVGNWRHSDGSLTAKCIERRSFQRGRPWAWWSWHFLSSPRGTWDVTYFHMFCLIWLSRQQSRCRIYFKDKDTEVEGSTRCKPRASAGRPVPFPRHVPG